MTIMFDDFIYSLSGSTCTNSSNTRDGVASTSSTSITATSSKAHNGITLVTTDTSSDTEHSHNSVPPTVSSNDVNGLTSIPLDTSIFVDETSTMNFGPVSSYSSDSSIDNGPDPVYIIIGVVIAIIVLGTVIALVAVVLFMKTR